MRIAIVSILFDTKGGSERRTYQLARGLIGAGHEVEIFAGSVEDMDLDAKVNVIPMKAGPSFLKVAGFARDVNRALASRKDLDVVHNQIRPFTDGIVTVGGGCHAEYLERSGKRLGFLNPLNHVVLGMEKERYREGGCRAVITNSEFAKKGILRHYPIPPGRVFVAYNGVDSSRFHPEKALERRAEVRAQYGFGDEPVVLFLGTGFERKGLATLIRALPVAIGMEHDIRRLKVLVAGKGDRKTYLRLAARLGVSDRIVFSGATTTPERLYGASDIFVLPTRYDPFSNATLEAMACGLPVVTTLQNGVSDIIVEGDNGFLMKDPEDHVGLAATMAYLSCEKARKEAGGKARRTAEGFTWEKTLLTTLEVYRATS